MGNWHYSWNGEKLGPVPLSELQQLIDEGTLQPEDLVWTSGMGDWQPAGSVTALDFPEEPPPLPEGQAIRQAMEGQWDQAFKSAAVWLWKHKGAFFFTGMVVFAIIAGVLNSMDVADEIVVCAMVPGFLCLGAWCIVGLYSIGRGINEWQRKTWLHQKWEAANGGAEWIQYSADGGFLRHDGFGAKYKFEPSQDRIELYPMDESEPIELKIVMLSEKELAITWDGKTLHFQKPSWWKRVFG